MGEVYLAKSVGAAGFTKHVVIKKILPHLTEHPQFVEGLVREAKLLLMLNHPNIVQVQDLDMDDNDYFMVMEFVHGYNLATIAHYCAQQRVLIPAPACAYIAIAVLGGLEYAHQLTGPDGERQNIIHRDVSPQNVLLSFEGHVKLTDFGIAKVLKDAEGEFTQSLKGKFRYMAPEAVDGGHIDQRYDLFACGILLFESLCRRHLFGGRDDVQILKQVRDAHVPSITKYHPGCPPALVEVTQRALLRDPVARFQTAGEFANALRDAIQPMSESDAGRVLRDFVKELYARGDFPINKPKMPNMDELRKMDATQSIVVQRASLNRMTRTGTTQTPPPTSTSNRSNHVIGLLLAAIVVVGAGVGVLLYILFNQNGSTSRLPLDSNLGISTRADLGVRPATAPDASLPVDAGAVKRDQMLPQADHKIVRTVRCRKFDPARAGRVFQRRGASLRRCYQRYGSASGTVVLKVKTLIRKNGRVGSVTVESQSPVPPKLKSCIVKTVKRLRFRCHTVGVGVVFSQPVRLFGSQ